MLGRRIVDEVESGEGEVAGLGLLPVDTVFAREKTLGRTSGSTTAWLGGAVPVRGFEIRHGQVHRDGGEPLFAAAGGGEDGCRVGAVLATSWHGVLEGDAFRRALLSWVASACGRRWTPGSERFAAVRERRLDALGDLIEEHADGDALLRLIEEGAPSDLPYLSAIPCSSS
jgi:adenosylcobyric acid synthase